VSVPGAPLEQAPYFVEQLPSRQCCVVGESLTVACSLAGSPLPRVEWFVNDGIPLVPQPDRYQLFTDGESATLK
jgi:hypothetical protein